MGFSRTSTAAGMALVAALAAGSPALAIDQLSEDHSASGCSSAAPVSDGSGTIAAWQGDCNPAGTNADGSLEIFRATVGSAPSQLTSGSGCSSMRPSISADGSRIAFESNCNLTGLNADGSVEIYLWKSSGTIAQLTNGVGCDSTSPSINGAGTFVAYETTCSIFGVENAGHGSEIFRVTPAGTVKQLTNDPVGDCDSTSPSINGAGDLVAYDSDCDPLGKNPDRAIEIFTVTANGAVSQRTTAPDDSCSSVHPAIDAAGSILAFQSDCNFTGKNVDRGDEVFTLEGASDLRQVTDSGSGAGCSSGEARMASGGRAISFSSYCNLTSSNGDASIEVFQVGVGKGTSGILQVTSSSSCSSLGGGISADGTRVMLDSDCNLAGNNADGSVEVFRTTACTCGAPFTRGASPKTSDALFVLRAAVGSSACAACECDTDASASIAASDALRVLKKAVGQNQALACPAP